MMTIDLDMAVADELAGGEASIAETKAEHHVVEAQFEHLQEVFTGPALAALGFGEELAELLFKHAVLVAKLLLLRHGGAVLGEFAAGVAHAVLSRRKIAQFEALGGAKNGHAKAAGNLVTGTGVSSHRKSKKS